MLLNGIRLTGYSSTDDSAQFELAGTDVKEVAALDGQLLTVTDDDGTQVEAFVGYSITSIQVVDETVRMRAVKVMDDGTAAAIEDLTQKVEAVSGKADDAKAKAENAAADAADAKTEAAEAKEAAEQAGTSPSVKAASTMYVNSTALTNSQMGDVLDLIEDFKPGSAYSKGLVRRYQGKYYRMAQDISAQTSQTYQPGTGTESLYTLIDLAPDGIRIWHMPTCAEDSFTYGEKAHYPDADGQIYVSQRVGNTSTPGTDEWWVLEG